MTICRDMPYLIQFKSGIGKIVKYESLSHPTNRMYVYSIGSNKYILHGANSPAVHLNRPYNRVLSSALLLYAHISYVMYVRCARNTQWLFFIWAIIYGGAIPTVRASVCPCVVNVTVFHSKGVVAPLFDYCTCRK